MPVFLIDTVCILLFYNKPAKEILGKRCKDAGWMWEINGGNISRNKDDAGNLIPAEELS